MKNWSSENEFYVGYLPTAPKGIASILRKIIVFLLASIIVVASILAWQQKKFSTANFEYGTTTTMEGYFFSKPVPHLLISLGKAHTGEELYETVLLVGTGKAGAMKFIKHVAPGEGERVKLNGFLIYGDGKTLLQLNDEHNMKQMDSRINVTTTMSTEHVTISGEIVDPKCYFGVMKPGEGKAHRSCAIRCIAGGIPPVLKTDSSGYMVIVGDDMKPVSPEIADIVGDHVTLVGTATKWNDWTIFQIDHRTIRQLSQQKRLKENLAAIAGSITMCGDF